LAEALLVSSLAVALACLLPFSFCGPFAVAAPSSCVGSSASSSIVAAGLPSCEPCDDLLPSSTAVSASSYAVLG